MFSKGFVIIVGGFTLTVGQNLFVVVVVVVCLTAFVGFCCCSLLRLVIAVLHKIFQSSIWS